ncbi:ATP-binding cassette domain-containing protein [Pseudonocardia sp. RS11V-5]|uniref:ATP-binding cassette domain-containing protein n=1 Tax=Pseudonocardia terrae TaxID=2905831 RepID=UPI001E4D9823|nr:ATP-binding cassette domain-containing protein [Pseudonocardia terrae]MCE3552861.1 ATP-binding cassette domain-containing protein [Pseudonocardia terrae]
MPAQPGPGVELSRVTTVLDGDPVLVRLGLRLAPGSVTVLMGPSGAGKTTLVNHLAGLRAPDAGRVRIDGEDVFAASEDRLRALRRDSGVLLGGSSLFDTSLFGSLTAWENLGYGLGERGIGEAERDRRAVRLLSSLGLEQWRDALPSAMPAHARRRLALARALAPEARLLVLDEVETGLDGPHAAGLVEVILDQHERTGATVLVTTHDLGLARELGGTLAVLCHGRIVGAGPAEALLRGIDDGAEFERRFVGGDVGGPPTLADAHRAIGEDDEPRTWEIDQRIILVAAAALIVVATLAALYLIGPPSGS